MKKLDMQAEEYVATGNIASEGMRNQLGRPRLDRLSLLVRESAQNAWDAKAARASFVTFGLAGWTLSPKQFDLLQQVVFAQRPPTSATDTSEAASLGQTIKDTSTMLKKHGDDRATRLAILAVYDRGTTGLCGPTRANVVGEPDEARDFVDFFRNVGTPPDKAQGGGTFGYGKAALYLASGAHTILVHTRTSRGSEPTSRFMGSALTNHYSKGDAFFTGRHWWGRCASDGVVDPVVDDEADELAEALGLPGYVRNTKGTTIAIVAPEFGVWAQQPRRALEYMVLQMLLNFWPKMVPWPGEQFPRMKFEASWEKEKLVAPDPASTPPLDGFVEALEAVRRAELERDADAEIYCKRPKQRLGRVALRKCFTQKTRLTEFVGQGTVPDIHTRSHHVALLRRPELVVEYRAFEPLPSDDVGYAGVFLADPDMDRVYAGAEPPTHDTWSPTILNDRRYQTFVRTTFKRLDERVRDFTGPVAVTAPAADGGPLATFADQLGTVLIGIEGPGASLQPVRPPPPKRPKGGRKKRAARPKVEVRDTGALKVIDGQRVRVFEVELRHAAGKPGSTMEAQLGTVLRGGGVEKDPPAGAHRPEVAFWRGPDGRDCGDDRTVAAVSEGVWTLGVRLPMDGVVTVEVAARPGTSR